MRKTRAIILTEKDISSKSITWTVVVQMLPMITLLFAKRSILIHSFGNNINRWISYKSKQGSNKCKTIKSYVNEYQSIVVVFRSFFFRTFRFTSKGTKRNLDKNIVLNLLDVTRSKNEISSRREILKRFNSFTFGHR